ncbi:MAG TPA: hypothetical protein DCL77_03190 [Prolixibacteraceae bacterium]|jgi:hypothetical protein|nr:hypothetical protein [Prolixibacteraceae bacterium]
MANDVYFFNPTCELAVANGSFSYMPPLLLREFERDCSALPFVFGTRNDFILTEKKPSFEFIRKLSDAGFEMPEFCTLKGLQSVTNSSFDTIIPWGWSPAAHFKLKELKDKCVLPFANSPVFNWTESHTTLYERITSLCFLKKFLDENPFDFFIDQSMTGAKVTSIKEIEGLVDKKHPLVLKAPLSSSGRGIQIIRKQTLNTSNKQWISGILNQQSYLIAEPYLDKVSDLSFQFRITDQGQPEYLGYSVFETNTNGQYKSSLIRPNMETTHFSETNKDTELIINLTASRLGEALKGSIYTQLHRGFLGIDALIYKDHEGLKMQPCIEINSRMNMGILTIQIEKNVDPKTTGKYELFYGKRGEFLQFATNCESQYPLKMKNGKLCAGFLPLVEPDGENQFGAYIFLETVTS